MGSPSLIRAARRRSTRHRVGQLDRRRGTWPIVSWHLDDSVFHSVGIKSLIHEATLIGTYLTSSPRTLFFFT